MSTSLRGLSHDAGLSLLETHRALLQLFEAKVLHLEKELHTAHTILDVQGKVAGLLGLNLNHGESC
jgi:hypothetical protein